MQGRALVATQVAAVLVAATAVSVAHGQVEQPLPNVPTPVADRVTDLRQRHP
jgi:hypothetical protein